MIFTHAEFLIFFATVLLYVALVRSNLWRKVFLLAASYYFYGYWDWRFCGLLLFCTTLNYLVAVGLGIARTPRLRTALVTIGVVGSLGLLGFFKYCDFFIGSLNALSGWTGLQLRTLQIVLPIGISFYTFQSVSYIIDVYRGEMEPCRNFLDMALYTAFFPHLVAGPIVRASHLLPQFREYRPLTSALFFSGFRLFIYGMVKKAVIADHVAVVADYVFGNPGAFGTATVWLGVLSYTVQIYCDFSGYTDMAIGAARMLGYDFLPNFDHPYLATSVADFWRRWHISLSTWLRDYLYIPLGGNRKGRRRTYINLILTMLLGGLWHGAAWTFVFWGLWHGVALAVERALGARGAATGGKLHQLLRWFVTMLIVAVGWVFFRAASFHDALVLLRIMFVPTAGVTWIAVWGLVGVCFVFITHSLQLTPWRRILALPANRLATPVILFVLMWLIVIYYPRGFQPFVYFQF